MEVSPRVIIYLLTAGVSLLSVKGNEGGLVNKTCVNAPETQTAPDGGSVTITCKYPTEKTSSSRYFCREDPDFNCTPLVQTFQANLTKLNRFSLTEDKQRGVYNVTISTLTMGDAGRYQCAMTRSDRSITCLTQVNLLIINWDDITPTANINQTEDTVQIKCSYPDSHKRNEKFLCKGKNPFNCEELINITAGNTSVVKGRYNITDDQRLKYFYVYINNLSKADSGTYWCGSDRTWQHATYNKIPLTVAERHIRSKKTIRAPPSTEKDATPDHDLPVDKGIIGPVAACLALLLILVVVLLLVRQKLLRIQGGSSEQRMDTGQNTEGNHGDHNYEEIEMHNQQASSGHALLSVYATVNPPSDQLHYASVVIQKDSAGVSTDGDALPDTHENGSSACEYSSVSMTRGSTLPPAAE